MANHDFKVLCVRANCTATFKSHAAMRKHVKIFQKHDAQRQWTCPETCGYSMIEFRNVETNKHMLNKHGMVRGQGKTWSLPQGAQAGSSKDKKQAAGDVGDKEEDEKMGEDGEEVDDHKGEEDAQPEWNCPEGCKCSLIKFRNSAADLHMWNQHGMIRGLGQTWSLPQGVQAGGSEDKNMAAGDADDNEEDEKMGGVGEEGDDKDEDEVSVTDMGEAMDMDEEHGKGKDLDEDMGDAGEMDSHKSHAEDLDENMGENPGSRKNDEPVEQEDLYSAD